MVSAATDASDRVNWLGARRSADHLSRDRMRDWIQPANAGTLDELVAAERLHSHRSSTGRRDRANFEGEEAPARNAPRQSHERAEGPQSRGDGTQGCGGRSPNLRSDSP